MATIRGQRNLKNVTAADTRVRNIDKLIIRTQPNRAPFSTLLDVIGQRKPTNAMKFEHGETDYLGFTVQVNGAHADTADTTIALDSSAVVKVNSILRCKRTGESFRVTANDTGTNTITVSTRPFAGTATALNDNDILIIASMPNEEGVAFSDAVSNEATLAYNYCQEFETAIEASNLQMAWEEYTNRDWQEMMELRTVEFKESIERALFWGIRSLITSGPNSKHIYSMGGMTEFITTNVTTTTGALTEKKLSDFLVPLYAKGSANDKVMICGPESRAVINRLAAGTIETPRTETVFGNSINAVTVNGRRFRVLESQMLSDAGYTDHLYVFDLSCLKKRVFKGNGMSFEREWRRNVQANDLKGRKDVLYCVEGLQRMNEAAHGILSGYSV